MGTLSSRERDRRPIWNMFYRGLGEHLEDDRLYKKQDDNIAFENNKTEKVNCFNREKTKASLPWKAESILSGDLYAVVGFYARFH